MDLDEFIANREEKKNTYVPPPIVNETITTLVRLLDVDYAPLVRKIKYKGFKPVLTGLKELNLYKLGWRGNFGTSNEWAGLCSAGGSSDLMGGTSKVNKNIFISIDMLNKDNNFKDNMLETVKHEITHAIVFELFYFRGMKNLLREIDDIHFETGGHGQVFKAICKKFNDGKPCSMFYKNLDMKTEYKFKYMYVCTYCEHKEYGKKDYFANKCAKCNKPIFVNPNPKY